MSVDLATKIQLGLEAFATVREQMAPLIAKPTGSKAGEIETAAACAMLHAFYTEIEKILKLIAHVWDARIPSSDAWHKELLNQMAAPTNHAAGGDHIGPRRDPKRVSRLSAFVSRGVHCANALGQAFSSRREGGLDVHPDTAGARNSISKRTLTIRNASVPTDCASWLSVLELESPCSERVSSWLPVVNR